MILLNPLNPDVNDKNVLSLDVESPFTVLLTISFICKNINNSDMNIGMAEAHLKQLRL